MAEYYLTIKALHVGSVIASVALFALRGLLVLIGRPTLGNHAVPRYLSYTIDTFLLTFALMLWTILKLDPVTHAWLGVKLVLLVVYIGLGSLALKRAQSTGMRMAAYAGALAVVFVMFGVARAHHPLGWLRWWEWL
jgi:uncharacterized membrane protein SirB2